MTTFIIICAAMLAAAVLWMVLPLLRSSAPEGAQDPSGEPHPGSRKERRISSLAIALLVPLLAVMMYASLSQWDWRMVQDVASRNEDMEQMLQQLQAKLAENPKDVDGWLLLGRSSAAMGRYPQAVAAYQQAYDLSQGQNVEAVIGLGEALVLTDETSLTGRASELFDAALVQAPNHPKALWYGSMAALQSGDLPRARERLKSLLEQDPPDELRGVLQRQIQDLDQQLAAAGAPQSEGAGPVDAAPGSQERRIRVAVTLDPQLQQQLTEPRTLFILARSPSGSGPPLAVQRHSSADLPLVIELSERDAMLPTLTIASMPQVQVVARLSRSGSPQAQSGDLYGEADYSFAGHDTGPGHKSDGNPAPDGDPQQDHPGGIVNITIDRAVP